MLLGQGMLTAACVVPRVVPDAVPQAVRPADATAHRSATEPATHPGQRPGALGRGPRKAARSRRSASRSMLLCLLPVPLGLWLVFARRARTRIAPDLGLRPARSDAADGIHRHGFLETDADDLQGAVPPAPRGAARIRLLALLRHDPPVREPRRGSVRDAHLPPAEVAGAARFAPDARAAGGQHPGLPHLHLRHAAGCCSCLRYETRPARHRAANGCCCSCSRRCERAASRTGRRSCKTAAARASGSPISTSSSSSARTW